MDVKRFTGPQAGSQKYDLLTAMAVAGLSGTSGFQTSMMRLIAVVTARYNWRNDELTVGQRDMARMWSVDERTVKREIKRLTASKILIQLRAGVRGRVAAYRMNYLEIYNLSESVWDKVGCDFSSRMQEQSPKTFEKVVRVDFKNRATAGGGDFEAEFADNDWGRIARRLSDANPAIFKSWFSELNFISLEGGLLTLSAPNNFVAQYIQTHHAKYLWEATKLERIKASRLTFEIIAK